MSATTSDKVGWTVAFVAMIVAVILALWPSLMAWADKGKKKGAGAGPGSGAVAPAGSSVDTDGVALAGSPYDEKGAPRQAVGAAGIPEPAPPPATASALHKFYPPAI